MRNPSQQKHDINRFKFNHHVQVAANPLLYRERRKKAHNVAPVIAPWYNQPTVLPIEYARVLRANISLLSEQGKSLYTSLTSDDLTIILDSGASCCMSPNMSDFIQGTYQAVKEKEVGGIGSGLAVSGTGKVE